MIANDSYCECDDVQVNLTSLKMQLHVLEAALKTVNNLSTELKKRDAENEKKVKTLQTKVQALMMTGMYFLILSVGLCDFAM